MALGFGKKKQGGDDWSDESLKQELAQLSGQEEGGVPAEDDPLADFMNDPAFADPAPDASQTMYAPMQPAAEPEPVYDEQPVRAKKKVSPLLLALGLVFLVVAGGVGVFFTLFNKAPVDDMEAPALPARMAKSAPPPGKPGAPAGPAKPGVPARPGAPVNPAVPAKPGTPTTAKPATPGTPAKPGVPPVGKPAPGKPVAGKPVAQPTIAPPLPVAPTPVKVLPKPMPTAGAAGQPGRGSSRTTTVRVGIPTVPLTPGLQSQLKALWKQGADAKHRKDYAGARKAWTQMLTLRPGHPGVQEAINKLPK